MFVGIFYEARYNEHQRYNIILTIYKSINNLLGNWYSYYNSPYHSNFLFSSKNSICYMMVSYL